MFPRPAAKAMASPQKVRATPLLAQLAHPDGTLAAPATAAAQGPLREAALRQIIEDLYRQEAMPKAKLVLWCLSRELGLQCSSDEVRSIVETSSSMLLEPPNPKKANYQIVLKQKPQGFREFADNEQNGLMEHPMPAAAEQEAENLLMEGAWPRGISSKADYERFELVAWMRGRSPLLFLQKFGRLHAYVRLAFSNKLLGRRVGCIVPWAHSEEQERIGNAELLRPTGLTSGERYVSSWPHLRHCLAELLNTSGGVLPIAVLKMKFRAHFQAELSETALGYTTLTGMLKDKLLEPLSMERENGKDVLKMSGKLPTSEAYEFAVERDYETIEEHKAGQRSTPWFDLSKQELVEACKQAADSHPTLEASLEERLKSRKDQHRVHSGKENIDNSTLQHHRKKWKLAATPKTMSHCNMQTTQVLVDKLKAKEPGSHAIQVKSKAGESDASLCATSLCTSARNLPKSTLALPSQNMEECAEGTIGNPSFSNQTTKPSNTVCVDLEQKLDGMGGPQKQAVEVWTEPLAYDVPEEGVPDVGISYSAIVKGKASMSPATNVASCDREDANPLALNSAKFCSISMQVHSKQVQGKKLNPDSISGVKPKAPPPFAKTIKKLLSSSSDHCKTADGEVWVKDVCADSVRIQRMRPPNSSHEDHDHIEAEMPSRNSRAAEEPSKSNVVRSRRREKRATNPKPPPHVKPSQAEDLLDATNRRCPSPPSKCSALTELSHPLVQPISSLEASSGAQEQSAFEPVDAGRLTSLLAEFTKAELPQEEEVAEVDATNLAAATPSNAAAHWLGQGCPSSESVSVDSSPQTTRSTPRLPVGAVIRKTFIEVPIPGGQQWLAKRSTSAPP